jgi:hypothetical protein
MDLNFLRAFCRAGLERIEMMLRLGILRGI